jgi:DmsE family decaheme c-type cytochrome
MVNRFKNAPAEAKSAVCLTCHSGNRHLTFWESGKHAKNDVACSDCHNIHDKTRSLTVAPFTTTSRPIEADTCGNCHKQVRNATLKPSHHPILEGKVKCSDCHNPHGALTHAMIKQETVNQQCYSCHADKRGPFVFSHPPVDENCLSCHTPHGSSHGKLLTDKAPNLCQDCHVAGRHPTNFYGSGQAWLQPDGTRNASPNTRFIARGCLNCHNSIHGSNAPSNRGQFLIR